MSSAPRSRIEFDDSQVEARAAFFALREVVEVGAPGLGTIDAAEDGIQLVERLRRLSAVAAVDLMQRIEDERLHVDQGHVSAKVMMAHLGGVSGPEAFRLDRIRRMVSGRADRVARAWRAGDLGIDRAVLLAKVYANPRVRDQFCTDQDWFVAQARKLSFPKLERRIARWIELADADGPSPAPDPTHERRDATLTQDHFSRAWNGRMSMGSLAGSRFAEVFGAYTDAEFELDCQAARDLAASQGRESTADDLPRRAAQRRADALCQMAEDAAANTTTSVRTKRVHNLVWQAESLEELLRRWAGGIPRPLDPDLLGLTDLDGNPLDCAHGVADLTVSAFRRVVQTPASVTIDLSQEHRLYVGLARLGVELQADECYWPGCHRPVTHCQIDHLRPAARGGLTEQANGAPACFRHNLIKEAGYVVTRRPDGTMQILTPLGELVR
ncbi:MAG: HNH endonuclease signature motif containing protein [Actinomycetota bacterium]